MANTILTAEEHDAMVLHASKEVAFGMPLACPHSQVVTIRSDAGVYQMCLCCGERRDSER